MIDNRKNYGVSLDRIIEKYTSTPKHDPELVDYSIRPKRKKLAMDRKEEEKWTRLVAENGRWSR